MRKLKLEIQLSLDGFVADHVGNTDWMIWNWSDPWTWDKELQQYHNDLTNSSDCILLSRKMAEEGFHNHWEQIKPDSALYAFAKPITDMRKIVFSKTLKKSLWKNTQLATGDLTKEVNKLKNETGKDIIAYGGSTFASSLTTAGLIDEYHLIVNPVTLGKGMPLFTEFTGKLNLKLVSCKAFACGVAVLQYIPA